MGLLEGLSFTSVLQIVQTFGLPGLVLVFWYVDHRRLDRIREEDKRQLETVLVRYKEDMRRVVDFYEKNVILVERYEKLAGELSGIIHLNTQVMTTLADQIKNNLFCPILREKGPRQ